MLHDGGVHEDRPADPYPTSSAGAVELPDAFGPDGVRVTVRVEPAVDRWRRAVKRTAPPNPLVPEAVVRAEQSFVSGVAQRYLLGDRWVVDVEADSGPRVRPRFDTRAEAVAAAKRIHAGVSARGTAFLNTLDI